MDFHQCRTCLGINDSENNKFLEDSICIFESNMKIAEVVMACASVEIISGDRLPNTICTMCVEYASSFYKFKKKCEESERELKLKMLKQEEVIDEDLCQSDQYDSEDETPLVLLAIRKDQSPPLKRSQIILNTSRKKLSECKGELTKPIVFRKHGLKRENKKNHQIDDKFVSNKNCLVCSLKFETQLELKEHYNTHEDVSGQDISRLVIDKEDPCKSPGYTKECIQCGLKFGSLKLLHEHQALHTEIKCLDCGKDFSTLRTLRRHKVRHCKVRFTPQFDCAICKLPFSNIEQLAEHRQLHNDRTCEYCGKNIMKGYEAKHLQMHEKNGLECLQCDATFTAIESYRQHMSSYTIFNCSDCPATFTNIQDFRLHKELHFFNSIHPEPSTDCPECEQSFDNRNALFQHFLTHTSFTCQSCKKRLRTLRDLFKHNRTNACESELGKRTCTVCNRVFNRTTHLRKHLLTHNAHVSTCRFCEFMAERPALLAQHMMSSHDDLRNVQCTECDKRFFTKFNMRQHRTIHTGQRRHICDYCGKVFALGNYLKEHIRIHTGERYSCAVCKKQFIQYRSLVSHMDMHLPPQQHICPICGKTYPRNGAMRIHMKRHREARPFECNACSKAFKTKQEMKKHADTHSGVRSHVCSVCSKAFGRKYALTVHMRIHTGETPHTCSVCEKRFMQAHCLRGHMKTHHGGG